MGRAQCVAIAPRRFSLKDRFMLRNLTFTLYLLLVGPAALASSTYQTPEDFLNAAFPDQPPEPAVIWLTGERKSIVEQILGHRYPTLRIRYWQFGRRSAWILDEVGKEQPITVGVVVNEARIETIKVLVFRESRGWEVRHPFFTDQFTAAQLNSERQLDRHIDGISGATLSVRAMTKLARLALYLDAAIREQDVTPSP
jgi:hypothetical protein